jgi:hypothetical protein
MFEASIASLKAILVDHPWISSVAAILPLSALIDFIDVPLKLHVFELVGGVPLWSWPVTPSGSRLLLSDNAARQPCCLDRFGRSVGLVALDGRYGEQYFVSSPETFRLAVSSRDAVDIENQHANMKGNDLRVQNLEVIYVRRTDPSRQHATSVSWRRHLLLDPWWMHSLLFTAMSLAGWTILFGCIAATVIFRFYIATAFLAVMPVTGLVVYAMYGSRPRRLLVNDASEFNRLILVSEHMNATDWTAVYGESTILNSLLNRPLEPAGRKVVSPAVLSLLRLLLRILILGQWAMAVGATATQNWNSYFITFWLVFCIFSHAFVITPTNQAKDWLRSSANLELYRYQTQVSSRRALLNTLISLNPDTFAETTGPQGQRTEDRTKLAEQAMRWIDPILKPTEDRTTWETATKEALNEVAGSSLADQTLDVHCSKDARYLSADWHSKYKNRRGEDMYWKKFISEGICVAANIRLHAGLPGRRVPIKIV